MLWLLANRLMITREWRDNQLCTQQRQIEINVYKAQNQRQSQSTSFLNQAGLEVNFQSFSPRITPSTPTTGEVKSPGK
jgi:hypothetical protein